MPGFPSQVDYPDIGARFYAFQPWFNEPRCLSVRFESLRTPEVRDDVCRDIVRHLMGETDAASMDSMVRRMIAGSCPRRSLTFLRGHGAEWRHLFTQEHKDAFKSHAGSLLIDLGYEKDMDW